MKGSAPEARPGNVADVPVGIVSPDARPGINARAKKTKPTKGVE
jgi:hypothetical protein